MIKKICKNCGKEFEVWNYRKDTAKYCSNKCNYIGLKGRIMPLKIREKISNSEKGRIFSKEHKLKLSLHAKSRKPKYGKDAYAWKGGKTSIQRCIRENYRKKHWVKTCLERDNFTCQLCNHRGGDLEVHHKFPFAKILDTYQIKTIQDAIKCDFLWNITNGLTLCKSCHKQIHRTL